jgi:hypothetical protein
MFLQGSRGPALLRQTGQCECEQGRGSVNVNGVECEEEVKKEDEGNKPEQTK